ncbi:RNA polymerase sigma-70 factor (sigma-E family) [Nocardioides aromaticivorans]|uniref:E family RNA polymerase sigma-70 factor n=1 Tax=Nocardioides aromaticivorans TaxID=200618 RepID=A0A7Y9ZJM1_9ACTN|nr:SigE family RNA polymerase sigma factor [Nocardioides aromaticivorans]NYI44666.1 RNA polymerase sigma-70 factor (sigma-E family) [Nocardioides aromaticivorans]QSR28639.1 E family RNA polymerase sigma-70 factor [Nocardioides aromaticivorans]
MPVIASRGPTEEEFVELVHAAWPALYRTAVLLVREHALAEDLVQTALARTYSNWHRIRDVGAAHGYARRALVTQTTSWYRRRSTRNERPTATLPERPAQGDTVSTVGERVDVAAALAQLSPRQRAVVVLRFYDDLSVQETADALGVAPGTVKSQTSVALTRLRTLLGDIELAATAPGGPHA